MPKVYLDAGHGGKDPGALGNGLQEKDINLSVALKIGNILKNHGVNAGYSRTTDVFVELQSRATMANNFGADVFVSIHCNAFSDPSARGVETYSYPGSNSGRNLAKAIQDNIIISGAYTVDRGIKTANFAVLRLTKMPAALIELAFITNSQDASILRNKQNDLAVTVAKGILKNLGIKYVENIAPETTSGKFYKVQVGAYSVKENAEKLLQELKEKGFNGFIKEDVIDVIKVEPPKPDYLEYETSNLYVQEVIPELCYVAFAQGKNLYQLSTPGINGTWQNNKEAHLPRAIWGLCANKNGAIGPNSYQNSPNGHKRGTIVYYEDGELDILRVNNINEFKKPIIWAIGGGSLIPEIISEENFASDILRNTHHTAVGIKDNRVYQIVTKKYCTMEQFKTTIKQEINPDKAIFLDGGGSTQMLTRSKKGLYQSRPLASGLFIKGV